MLSLLEKILEFLDFRMTSPTNYGWFHILCLIVLISIIVLLFKYKPSSKKSILIISIIMILFEIYKELDFSYSNGVWDYPWYIFPFQFCSTPMYIGLLAGLTKNKKIESYCYSFLATYGLVAGISVMLYPSTCFVSDVLIDVQTMVHHGSMVLMGFLLYINNDIDLSFKTIKKGFSIFIILVAIALTVNIVTYYIDFEEGFELFYISPYHESILPIFDKLSTTVWYPLFLGLYLLVFSMGTSIPLGIAMLIKKEKKLKKILFFKK